MKKSVRKQRKSLRNKRRNTKKQSRKTRVNTKRGGNWFTEKLTKPFTTDPCKIVEHARLHKDTRTYSFDVKDPTVLKDVGYLTASNPLTPSAYKNKVEECKIQNEKAQKKPITFTTFTLPEAEASE